MDLIYDLPIKVDDWIEQTVTQVKKYTDRSLLRLEERS